MSFYELAQKRSCCRDFLPKPVPDEAIYTLLKAARAAPSAGNLQPWHMYAVSDPQVIADMHPRVYAGPWITSAAAVIVVCVVAGVSEARYKERGRTLYCFQDTAAAVQNILLCAEDLGLGACWIGAFDEESCRGLLRMPQSHRPVAMIPLGYAGTPPVKPGRKPLEDCVTFIGNQNAARDGEEAPHTPAFRHCNMGGTVFEDVSLRNSRFTNINMQEIQISDANLKNAEINECDCSGLTIKNCIADGMTVNGKPVV